MRSTPSSVRTKPTANSLGRALATPAEPAHPTLAQRIADDLGVAIVDGALADGSRIREEELARHYGASRSPVREAIGLLERRGLVRTVPRRGTHVVGQSLDVIAYVFNMRAVLVGWRAATSRAGATPLSLRNCRRT